MLLFGFGGALWGVKRLTNSQNTLKKTDPVCGMIVGGGTCLVKLQTGFLAVDDVCRRYPVWGDDICGQATDRFSGSGRRLWGLQCVCGGGG